MSAGQIYLFLFVLIIVEVFVFLPLSFIEINTPQTSEISERGIIIPKSSVFTQITVIWGILIAVFTALALASGIGSIFGG